MNLNVEQLQDYLTEVVVRLAKTTDSIVFKGAAYARCQWTDFPRYTRDIDLDTNIDAEKFQKILIETFPEYLVEFFRPNIADTQSAGFKLLHKELQFIIRMDVNISQLGPHKIVVVNGVNVIGATMEEVFADKLTVICSQKVFRRIKDLIDLNFYLSKGIRPNIPDLPLTRPLENAANFLEGKDKCAHAYLKFDTGMEKLPFDEVYENVYNYLVEQQIIKAKD